VIVLVIYGYFFSDNPAGLRALSAVFVLSVFRLVPAINRLLVGVMKLKLYQYTIEFLHHSQHQNKIANHESIHFTSNILVKDIFYKYDDSNEPLLKNISFQINKGEVFGIFGRSGSGKSTLMKMISGLIHPQKGEVFIDNELLNDHNLQAWQNQIGFVHQSPFIFNKTIYENIALSSNYNKEKIEKAIQKAGLEEFLEHLPKGLETILGEQGSRLSEGQKQRIAIARALYKDANVLLFDEATSSLDSTTEDIIIESLQHLKKQNVTIVIIAHRKRIIDLCDNHFQIDSEL
jgi:ABC-type bacteriocin/lantibiotic exporter with double-glycine peptidase domain